MSRTILPYESSRCWALDALDVLAKEGGLPLPSEGVVTEETSIQMAKEQIQHGSLEIRPVRFREVLERVLLSESAEKGLELCKETGLLSMWLPEVAHTIDLSQESGRMHKDVWGHTKQVVAQSVAYPVVRWAALFHDIGKVKTRGWTEDGKVHFHGHAEVGADMFDAGMGKRLGFSLSMQSELSVLIRNHLRPNQYKRTWTDSAVRRLVKEVGSCWPELLQLSRADVTSSKPGKRQEAIASVDDLERRIREIQKRESEVGILPKGIGHHILERFKGIEPKQIGVFKSWLEESIRSGAVLGGQGVEVYLSHLALQFGIK